MKTPIRFAKSLLAVFGLVFSTLVSGQEIISTVAGTYAGHTGGYTGDGGPATSAKLDRPTGAAFDGSGNMYIADTNNGVVRKVAPDGTISTVAGDHAAAFTYSGDGGPAINAGLFFPYGVALDGGGNLYIADEYNNVIRKVMPGGIISTVAGDHAAGRTYSGDGGPAIAAGMDHPYGVAVDRAGNLYIADSNNHVIRKVAPDGTISTVAGNNTFGYSGDGGPATGAQLYAPLGVAVDRSGALYIADERNYVIRRVALDATISTVAGNHILGYTGDGGPAVNAQLGQVTGVAFDRTGNMYIADNYHSLVRRVALDGIISTVAGNALAGAGYSGDGGAATAAQLASPWGVAVDGARLYIADTNNYLIRRVELNLIFANGFEQ